MTAVDVSTPALSRKIARLVEKLTTEFDNKEAGHCVRVDYLRPDEARTACRLLREQQQRGVDVWVLASDTNRSVPPDALSLFADHAIELRNRKDASLCLFIPADLLDATASSLGNSFAPFPVQTFLKTLANELRAEIKNDYLDIYPHITAVLRQLRGAAAVTTEQEIAYLSVVLDDPKPKTVAAKLWHVGLIPDCSNAYLDDETEFARRLELNRKCVDALARPLRPQSSVADRIAALKLQPNTIQATLAQFLLGRRLQSDRQWLEEIAARSDDLTFDHWIFPEVETSDLEGVEVEPFDARSGLEDLTTGEVPFARCGDRAKLTVKWKPLPLKPKDVGAWRVELVPNPDKYGPDEAQSVDLPSVTVRGTSRSAKIPLAIDTETLTIHEVVARVVALDANNLEILTGEKDDEDEPVPVQALSVPFYLEQGEGPVDETERKPRLKTERSLYDGLLTYSFTAKRPGVRIERQADDERDLLYLPFLLHNDGKGAMLQRVVVRLATPPFLRDLQIQTLDSPDNGGRYQAKVRGADALQSDKVTVNAPIIPSALADVWERFTKTRKAAFDAIRKSRPGTSAAKTTPAKDNPGLIQSADLTPALSKLIAEYAKAHADLLDAASVALAQRDIAEGDAAALLELDTLALDFGEPKRRATVLLPTHPLRLLWYMAYARWMERIAEDLRELTPKERKARFDPATLERLAPLNLPALLIRQPDAAEPSTAERHAAIRGNMGRGAEIFADNLDLFHGVLLPIGIGDPGALLGETARAVGFDDFAPTLTDLKPEQLAREIKAYLNLHPYLQTVRVNAVNPGSGAFLKAALDDAFKPKRDDDERATPALRLDLITHTESSAQIPAEGLEAIVGEWFRAVQRERGTFLRPAIQIARRALPADSNAARAVLETIPGGDAHLTICQDYYKPVCTLDSTPDSLVPQSSAALFGLLTRFQSSFTVRDGIAEWTRKVAFAPIGDDKHPVDKRYSDLMVDGQESYLRLCACLLDPAHTDAGHVPALRLAVSPEQRALVDSLHGQSDWVFTLDRHFGVEYYDSPRDVTLGRAAEQYLLDYSPEFLEGLGHCLVATTGWQEEVGDVLSRALAHLQLACDPDSVRLTLDLLKTISGRLALRLIGLEESTLALETVSLAVVASYLHRRGKLHNTILVPLDAHQDLFRDAKAAETAESAGHCDLILVTWKQKRINIEFIEVKYRSGEGPFPSVYADIETQTGLAEDTIRRRFFADPSRLDAPILRCQFASILRFYAERARRHGRFANDGQYAEVLANLARLEAGGIKSLVSQRTGYVVVPNSTERKSVKQGDLTIHFLARPLIESDTDFQCRPLAGEEARGRKDEEEKKEQETDAPVSKNVANEASTVLENDRPDEPENSRLLAVSESLPAPILNVLRPTEPKANEVKDEEAPVLVAKPAVESRDLIVPLGSDVYTDAEIVWTGSVKGSPHLFVLGIPGQGKSWTILRLVGAAARSGVPSLIIDFHGQFADADTPLAAEASPRVIDVSRGLPFSPLEASRYRGSGANYWKTNSLHVSEILQYVYSLGDMQRDQLYEAISGAYRQAGYEENDLDKTAPPLDTPRISDVFTRLQSLEALSGGRRNTIARCRTLFEFGLFQDDAEVEDDGVIRAEGANDSGGSRFTFADIRCRTTVIDLHSVGEETVQAAAGAFVLRKLYKEMFLWGESDRLRLLIVLDEAHRMAKDTTLPRLMKEGRKYGIAVVVASQSANDFHLEVLQNAGTKIMFRTNYPISKKVSGYLKAPRYFSDVTARLEGLEVGHALVQTPDMKQCSEVSMYPYRHD